MFLIPWMSQWHLKTRLYRVILQGSVIISYISIFSCLVGHLALRSDSNGYFMKDNDLGLCFRAVWSTSILIKLKVLIFRPFKSSVKGFQLRTSRVLVSHSWGDLAAVFSLWWIASVPYVQLKTLLFFFEPAHCYKLDNQDPWRVMCRLTMTSVWSRFII